MLAWWRRRSLRTRLTLVASAALAIGLAAGSLLLVQGFARSRVNAIDATSQTVADNIADLTAGDALPTILPVQSGESAQVLDGDGGVVAVSPGTLRTLPLVPIGVAASLAGHGPADRHVDIVDGQSLSRVIVESVGSGADRRYVVVSASLSDEQDTLRGLTRIVVITAPLLLVAVAGAMWLLLGRALAAVSGLRSAAEAVTDFSRPTRLPLPASSDEIHALAVTLNAMLDRLHAAGQRERTFVADAAHELRSPLASMRAQLDVAATHPDSTNVADLASGTLTDVDRLAALVDDLLLLARLDAQARSATTGGLAQTVDLAALAGRPDQGPAVVHGDPAALRRVIDNLTANARRHARSRVEVSVQAAPTGTVQLLVEDDGPGIAAGDRERIFDRFVRLDGARARDEGGSGLGLAIARATARAHGGDLEVTDSALGGAGFVLTLPGANGTDSVG